MSPASIDAKGPLASGPRKSRNTLTAAPYPLVVDGFVDILLSPSHCEKNSCTEGVRILRWPTEVRMESRTLRACLSLKEPLPACSEASSHAMQTRWAALRSVCFVLLNARFPSGSVNAQ